jgi:hypothetical protein
MSDAMSESMSELSESVCRQALADYLACRAALGAGADLPILQAVQVQFVQQQVAGWQALAACIRQFEPQAGWLAWQCCAPGQEPVQVLQWDEEPLQRLGPDNALLEAQLCNGAASLHIKLAGVDRWHCTGVRELAADGGPNSAPNSAPETAGTLGKHISGILPAVAEPVAHVGKKGLAALQYQVLWMPVDGMGMCAKASRLTGVRLQTADGDAEEMTT